MKVKKLIILVGVGALLASLGVGWYLVESSTKLKTSKVKSVTTNNVKATKYTSELDADKYYRAHPYVRKAKKLNEANLYDSAIFYYQKAAANFEKDKQWRGYVWAINYVSRLYLLVNKQNYSNALPFLKSAMAKKKEIGEDHPFLATTLYYRGLYYYKEKQIEQALKDYQKSLTIKINNHGEQNLEVADIYNAIGDIHFYLQFNSKAAERNYEKSLQIKETLTDKTDPSLIYNYYNLLNLNILLGDYAKAESLGYKAIQSLDYVSNNKIYWSELLEAVMANLYVEQSNFKKAIPKLNNAIALNLKNDGDKQYLSFYYNSLGEIYSRKSDPDSAIFYFKNALQLTGNNYNYNIPLNESAYTLFNLGTTYYKLKQYKTAFHYFKKCLNTRLQIYGDKHIETAVAYQNIGNVYQHSGSLDSSIIFLQRALIASTKDFNTQDIYTVPLVSNINSNYDSFQILKDKAAVLQKLYLKDSANTKLLETSLKYYCLTDTLLTNFRSEYYRESSKLNYLKTNNNIYEEAIACATLLYHKTGRNVYLENVFQFIDKRKSSLLWEALYEKEKYKELNIPLEEHKKLQALQQELIFLESQIEEENSKPEPDDETLRLLHAKIYNIETKSKTVQKKLNKRFFISTNQSKNQDTLLVADLQTYTRQHNSLFLEYFWGDSAIYILGVYKDKRALVKVNKTTKLENQIYKLYGTLVNGYQVSTKTQDFSDFQQSSFYIYNMLVKPIFIQLGLDILEKQHKPALIIVPDGLSTFLPFEILTTETINNNTVNYKNLPYLIKDYVISYEYSGRLLLQKYLQPTSNKNSRVLAFSFSKSNSSKSEFGKLVSLRANKYSELPGSAKELNAIATHMKGQFYMGEEATEYLFKREAPKYDILHLAVHGEANTKNTFNSKLIFKSKSDSVNDGSLHHYELYKLKLKAKLAVLSACESGLGKFNVGEGVYSMARGFINAGCGAVVMSYWKVNDNATAAIMNNFYQELSQGEQINTSIRKAKLAFLQQGDRRAAHPANWAAFVAIGNMEPVVTFNPLKTILISLISVMLLMSIAYWWVRGKTIMFKRN